MALVSIDSNVVDLAEKACATPEHIDAMEAMEPPPRFRPMHHQMEAEVFACYWLLAMAPAWRSTVYTFADALYEEVSRAPKASYLLRFTGDVLVRDDQEPEHRIPDPVIRPPHDDVIALGVKALDAIHVADAVALHADYLLTNDRQLRNRTADLEAQWGLKVRRPSEFLVEAVRDGAPWSVWAPWPWESLERIRLGRPTLTASS